MPPAPPVTTATFCTLACAMPPPCRPPPERRGGGTGEVRLLASLNMDYVHIHEFRSEVRRPRPRARRAARRLGSTAGAEGDRRRARLPEEQRARPGADAGLARLCRAGCQRAL